MQKSIQHLAALGQQDDRMTILGIIHWKYNALAASPMYSARHNELAGFCLSPAILTVLLIAGKDGLHFLQLNQSQSTPYNPWEVCDDLADSFRAPLAIILQIEEIARSDLVQFRWSSGHRSCQHPQRRDSRLPLKPMAHC
jgi:hypothetical protein